MVITGEIHIFDVYPWTQTPISVDVDIFDIPLFTYSLIKPHIKPVPIPILDTDTVISIGSI